MVLPCFDFNGNFDTPAMNTILNAILSLILGRPGIPEACVHVIYIVLTSSKELLLRKFNYLFRPALLKSYFEILCHQGTIYRRLLVHKSSTTVSLFSVENSETPEIIEPSPADLVRLLSLSLPTHSFLEIIRSNEFALFSKSSMYHRICRWIRIIGAFTRVFDWSWA